MNHRLVEASCSDIRRQARELLRGRWKNAMLISLVYSLALSGVSTIITMIFGGPYGFADTGLGSIYLLLVAGPLTYGYIISLRQIARGEQATIGDLFSGFEDFGKFFIVNLLLMIFIILWSLLLVIPGIIASLAYSMVYFLMMDNGSLKATESIRLSKQKMKGNKGTFFVLNLSFIGWVILFVIVVMVVMMVSMGGASYAYFLGITEFNENTMNIMGSQWVANQIISLVFAIAWDMLLLPYITMAHFVFYRHLADDPALSLADAAPANPQDPEQRESLMSPTQYEQPSLAQEETPPSLTESESREIPTDPEAPENKEE